jgi:hypothetical protein
LRKPPKLPKRNWLGKLQDWAADALPSRDRDRCVYEIADRDEGGFRELAELRNRGIAGVAEALAQSAEHIKNFFEMLRIELGFYVRRLNLRDRLTQKGEPICFPEPVVPRNCTFVQGALRRFTEPPHTGSGGRKRYHRGWKDPDHHHGAPIGVASPPSFGAQALRSW